MPGLLIWQRKVRIEQFEKLFVCFAIYLGVPPNDRDGISAIPLCFPGMCSGVNGDASLTFIRSASAMSKSAATLEDLVAILVTHEIDGELSLNSATCLCRKHGAIASSTSQHNNNPASSKSEFVMGPFGFSIVQTSACTSGGHSSRKTVGMHLSISPNATPPVPSCAASMMPIKCGYPVMSSLHNVGRR